MAVILGLLVALAYGGGDFFGGLAAKRVRATAVVVGSFGLSAALLWCTQALWSAVGDPPPATGRDLILGVAVGAVGPASLALLYRGLAGGRMSVVAPITAVAGAVVPFGWGLATGDRPGTIALVGVAVAVLSVGLISAAPAHPSTVLDHAPATGTALTTVVAPSVASGIGFGVVFILLGSASDDPGLWPLLAARPTSVCLAVATLAVAAARTGTPLAEMAWPAGTWVLVAASGVLDVVANALYLAATQHGMLAIVAVLSSLYPAATVVLARVVLHERLHRAQVVGLCLAAAGVAAMSLS